MENSKKKLIIIGAGISGMTAGIYALENGYDVTIYEKHAIAGGQCTGWNRKGAYIDGCAHWIVGTNPKSDFYPMWRHVGAFDSNTVIYNTEYFSKFDINGEIVTFYADLNKLEQELLRISPIDKKQIRRFINGIKAYKSAKVPTKKPLDYNNFFDWIGYGFQLLPMAFHFMMYQRTSVKQYAQKFKSKILQEAFLRFMPGNYNIHSLIYIMKSLATFDAGMVEGGSRNFAFNIKNTFIEKGGKLVVNAEVDHVLIENDTAKGIVFKDGSVVNSDYVIASCDAHHTINKLLQGKYADKFYEKRFNNSIDYPLITCCQLSYKVNKVLFYFPKMINININPYKLGNMEINNITLRNHSFDNTLNKSISTITVLLDCNDSVYEYLSSLDRKTYLKEKEKMGNHILKEIMSYISLNEQEIELVDVSTPLTYQRYTNAYKGSYMSFLTTNKSKGLMRKGLIKGLKNFALAGQWIMPPGGLPIALFTGKFAAIRITKMDKKKFVDLDYLYESNYNKNGLRAS